MKKLSNKTLLIAFIVLAIVVGAVYLYDSSKGERTFKSELFSVDSAKVSSITIYPKNKTEGLVLSGSGKNWTVKSGGKTFQADTAAVQQIIGAIVRALPERVAATDASGWKALEIDDSASMRVVVAEGSETVADFRLGKVSFSQGNQNRGYGGRQNMVVKSHIRVAGDDKVYVVDGFLSFMFSDQPSRYRNKLVTAFDRSRVNRLTFVYPGDSSFVLARSGNHWMVDGKPADSAKMITYLNPISQSSNMEMADDNSQAPGLFPYQLTIEGDNMAAIRVEGATDLASGRHFVKSSMNQESVFVSANGSLFQQFFKGKTYFVPSTEKRREK